MAATAAAPLVRTIGRWTLVGLVLNSILGTGVFVLPGTLGGGLGPAALFAWLLAAGLVGVMILAFAEVASRFRAAGGAYLYAHAAFGPFAGLQMAWMAYFVRCITAAVQANLFTTYMAELWPGAATRAGGIAVTTAFIALHAGVNVCSVRSSAGVSNVFAVIKLGPLIAFGALGLVWLALGHASAPAVAVDPSFGGWAEALLLLMFAYGGFESALIPLSEAKEPRRDAPFALITGLALVTVVYLAVQATVLVTLTEPGATSRPLAASARMMLGSGGAVAITVVALASVYGWLASNMLNVPRMTMAMAERGELPALFARVHPRFGTPWVSVLVFAALSLALALQAGLLENLSLSAVSRLFVYGGVCAALPVFRWQEAHGSVSPGVEPAAFRVRGGSALAVIGVVLAACLATRMSGREGIAVVVTLAVGAGHWGYLRWRGGASGRRARGR